MANANYVTSTGFLGANISGVTDDQLLPLNTTALIQNNKIALYVQTESQLNPGATCTVTATGSVSATSGTGLFIALNSTTAGTAQFLWVRAINNIAR